MTLSITPVVGYGTAQLPSGNTVLYTAPSTPVAGGAVLTKLVASNPTGSSGTITLYVVRSGGSAVGTTTTLVPALTIQAGSDVIINEVSNLVLGPGDELVATPSAAATINVTLSGYTFLRS